MTFYVQTYPFGFAQDRPYRRMARRWAENRERTLEINVREEDDAYILSALVPGIKSEELNIQVLEDVVRIEVARGLEAAVGVLHSGSFHRALRLPASIDAEHVEANITNGVLTLRLPKAESARPKQIKIQSR